MPDLILTERHDAVLLLRLNRPEALNALSDALVAQLNAALDAAEADAGVRVVVIAGSERAFAAGADIREMAERGFADAYAGDFIGAWDRLARVRKPTIAAVAGFALGGGCELAMMCDIIIAADSAKFGQPEITLGILPGAGGTQRLTRAIGKAKAMEMVLTGRMMDASEAERAGLVARVVPVAELEAAVLELAAKIAAQPAVAAMLAKEAVNAAADDSAGLALERRLFYAAFATADQKEGMAAFLAKRKPSFGQTP